MVVTDNCAFAVKTTQKKKEKKKEDYLDFRIIPFPPDGHIISVPQKYQKVLVQAACEESTRS